MSEIGEEGMRGEKEEREHVGWMSKRIFSKSD